MNLEDTIKDKFNRFPVLYGTSNRKKVLDSLFVTIGNGYYWDKGELVESPISIKSEDKAFYKKEPYFKSNLLLYKDIYKLSTTQAKIKAVANYKKLIKEADETPVDWYGLDPEHSLMFEYPEDIKPDWLNGIIETCISIIEDVDNKTVTKRDVQLCFTLLECILKIKRLPSYTKLSKTTSFSVVQRTEYNKKVKERNNLLKSHKELVLLLAKSTLTDDSAQITRLRTLIASNSLLFIKIVDDINIVKDT